MFGLAVVAALAVGVALRLEDPSSSPVVAAEDPYTHMALVREHVRDGSLDPLNNPGTLYPPGMHAVVATAWAFSGADLYSLVRFGPVLFGALSILGVAALLWRFDGPVAATVGALAVAVMPEEIFRTTMMAPTALDLALVPLLLLALLEVALGRLAWTWVAALIALFLVFSHPWVLAALAVSGLAFLVVVRVVPGPPREDRTLTATGLAVTMAVLGGALGLSLSGCGGLCGSGFRDILEGGERFTALAPAIAAFSFTPLAALRFRPHSLDWLVPGPSRPPATRGARIVWTCSLAVVLAATVLPAVAIGMPEFVDLPGMFGWPVLVLAAAGFVALPFLASPVSRLAAALAVATLPLVIYNPLDSPFWPHRTAVYLGLAAALLAGLACGAAARAGQAAVAMAGAQRVAGTRTILGPALALVPMLVVAGGAGATVYTETPPSYAWYRLFTPCEFEALQQTAAVAEEDPTALLVTADWQAKLVLAGLAPDPARIWFKPDFFNDTDQRQGVIAYAGQQHWTLVAVADSYLPAASPGGSGAFLDSPPWQPLASCTPPGATTSTLRSAIIPGE